MASTLITAGVSETPVPMDAQKSISERREVAVDHFYNEVYFLIGLYHLLFNREYVNAGLHYLPLFEGSPSPVSQTFFFSNACRVAPCTKMYVAMLPAMHVFFHYTVLCFGNFGPPRTFS